MKYIKLYEETFYKMGEYEESSKEIKINYELVGSLVYKIFDTFTKDIIRQYPNFGYIKLYSSIDNVDHLNIFKLEDDYYRVDLYYNFYCTRFKCDQISGLKSCLSMIKKECRF